MESHADLGNFIDQLRKLGELKVFEGADGVFRTDKRSALSLGIPLDLCGVDLLNAWRSHGPQTSDNC